MQASPLQPMHAEQAYLFRHALVRDAAYGLQPPAGRASLHRLALEIMEAIHPDAERDPIAAELASHARQAQADSDTAMQRAELAYTWRAGRYLLSNYSPEATQWFDAAARLEPDPLQRAHALQDAANWLLQIGHAGQARPRLLEALQLAQAKADLSLQSSITNGLSLVSRMLGREADAMAFTKEALELARAAQDPRTEASAVNGLAVMEAGAGRLETAFELFNQALALTRKSGSRADESMCLGNLAMCLVDSDRFEEALAAGEQALKAGLESRNRRGEGITCGMMAMILGKLGRHQEAVSGYRRALKIHQETCNRAYEAYDRCRMAMVLLTLGDEAAARAEWHAGLEQMLTYGDQGDLPTTLNDMQAGCASAGIAPFYEVPKA